MCIDGVKSRQGKTRSDMPWTETEDDEEFLEFIKNYNSQSRPSVLNLLEQYSKKEIVVFKSREEADKYLKNFQE